jgi:tRNA1(Val) A37 N6-methylase TrmN6
MEHETGTSADGIETTDDAFLGGRLTIAQTRQGSRAGIDAVFLAASSPVEPGGRVLELGSGSGIVSLAIARRVEGADVTGVEIDPALCHLAEQNAARNGLQTCSRFICGDATGAASALFASGLKPDSFDHGVANPPFLTAGEARLPEETRLRRAHALKEGELERWIRCLATFIKPRGSITLIHRADALPQLIQGCAGRFGALTVYPLFPRQSVAANRIILQGRKGSRAPLKLMPGMVLHTREGRDFTKEAQSILRDGSGLKF